MLPLPPHFEDKSGSTFEEKPKWEERLEDPQVRAQAAKIISHLKGIPPHLIDFYSTLARLDPLLEFSGTESFVGCDDLRIFSESGPAAENLKVSDLFENPQYNSHELAPFLIASGDQSLFRAYQQYAYKFATEGPKSVMEEREKFYQELNRALGVEDDQNHPLRTQALDADFKFTNFLKTLPLDSSALEANPQAIRQFAQLLADRNQSYAKLYEFRIERAGKVNEKYREWAKETKWNIFGDQPKPEEANTAPSPADLETSAVIATTPVLPAQPLIPLPSTDTSSKLVEPHRVELRSLADVVRFIRTSIEQGKPAAFNLSASQAKEIIGSIAQSIENAQLNGMTLNIHYPQASGEMQVAVNKGKWWDIAIDYTLQNNPNNIEVSFAKAEATPKKIGVFGMGVDVQKRVNEVLGQSTVNEIIRQQLQQRIDPEGKGIQIDDLKLQITGKNELGVMVDGHRVRA